MVEECRVFAFRLGMNLCIQGFRCDFSNFGTYLETNHAVSGGGQSWSVFGNPQTKPGTPNPKP